MALDVPFKILNIMFMSFSKKILKDQISYLFAREKSFFSCLFVLETREEDCKVNILFTKLNSFILRNFHLCWQWGHTTDCRQIWDFSWKGIPSFSESGFQSP